MKANALPCLLGLALLSASPASAAPVEGWLQWRGPEQSGVSREASLPESCKPGTADELWSYELRGRGTAVIAGDRLYAIGYRGEKADLQEVLICLDASTGKLHWERAFSDFLSDIIYNRYSIGAPSVDAETGNVYVMTSPGLLCAFTADGAPLWQRSMMEEFGRLTFPNGRTGTPAIDGDLVIVDAITSNWGREGPARSRFYAFDKRSGQLVWRSTPGTRPRDSSFSTPFFEWRGGKRVFYVGTGCGHVAAVNARTGEPIWRFAMSFGGVNSSVVRYKDRIVAIHGRENRDDSTAGRMVALKLGSERGDGSKEPRVLGKESELWRNELGMFTSSPTIVGKRVYQVTTKGVLASVDVETGKIVWKKKLAPAQLHASPLYGAGKLYIPIWTGEFFILKPSADGVEVVQEVKLEGNAIGSPSAWRGRVYVHTTEKLYCFGPKEPTAPPAAIAVEPAPEAGPATRLMPVPNEVLLRAGAKASFELRPVDAKGLAAKGPTAKPSWAGFIPPTAKVKASLDASFNEAGELAAGADAKPSAGAFKVTAGDLTGFVRGRVMSALPYKEGFEGFTLGVDHAKEAGVKFSYPPLPWIGGRFKWEIRELEGQKVLSKTLDRVLFQRSTTFLGPADLKNYTMTAEIRSDGNRRLMSSAGVINQRYVILLDGNWQQIQVVSNHDRVKAVAPFAWRPKRWYVLKSRVDINPDGSGVIRAKAWVKGEAEPEGWLLEASHKDAHKNGAPGLFAFAPQSRFRVYVDNISITAND
jgi:outer membrane protein assembly factor BamB